MITTSPGRNTVPAASTSGVLGRVHDDEGVVDGMDGVAAAWHRQLLGGPARVAERRTAQQLGDDGVGRGDLDPDRP
jgi:hypothetical protein